MIPVHRSSKLDFATTLSYNWLPMEEIGSQSRLPVTSPPRFVNQGFVWVSNRRTLLKTRRLSGISSFLLLPVFLLEFLFLALIIGLLLLFFALYVIFHLASSLPKLKKRNSGYHR